MTLPSAPLLGSGKNEERTKGLILREKVDEKKLNVPGLWTIAWIKQRENMKE